MSRSQKPLGFVVLGLSLAIGVLAAHALITGRYRPHRPRPPGVPECGDQRAERGSTPPGMVPRLDRSVLERAKSATVFIQVRSRDYLTGKVAEESSGSGFLVSDKGHVATCWHVVSASKNVAGVAVPLETEDIKVILRSGKRDQRVLPARLLAADPPADLALLKVETQDAPHLELGETGGLVETAPLWVLGFPLGRVFSVLQRGPEISVNGGTVSSLRHDDLGRLQKVQFDAVVIPGNSGGPVITPRGEVVGVANIALGTSRVNFAIPAAKLSRLIAGCPLSARVGERCRLKIESKPPGAQVYVDSRALGTTPLEVKTGGGYRRVVIRAPGYHSWARQLSIYDGRKISAEEAKLEPLERITLNARTVPIGKVGGGRAMRRGASIFTEDFSDVKTADRWKQDTGGSDQQRTWYVEDGALHQFSDDGMLHAVFAERSELSDYAFSARVRIRRNEKDGRAGLIFRSTPDGFALFRLHRATDKVQLAYHVNQPFGWRVLDERALDFEVKGDHWYHMEVQALGRQVVCLLDGKVVMQATIQRRAAGKVGFYSVDSRAAFDDVRVNEVSDPGRKAARAPILRGFWFSDNFEKSCGYWRASSSGAPAAPWPMVPSGHLQLDAKAEKATNVLAAYDISDAMFNTLVSSRGDAVGLVFRCRDRKHYLFEVCPARDLVQLVLVDDGQRKVLAKAEGEAVRAQLGRLSRRIAMHRGNPRPNADLLANVLSLYVLTAGGHLRAGLNGQILVEARDNTLKSGMIGLYTDRARAVFHSLDVASPTRQP